MYDLSALRSDQALDESIHKVCFSLVSIFILFCKFKNSTKFVANNSDKEILRE